jgi:integrase
MTLFLDAYVQRLQAAGRSEETIGARTRVLRRIDRILPHGLNEACGDELTHILATCRKAWTLATYYSALNSYYTNMLDAGQIDFNPMTTVPRPKPGDSTPHPVTDGELAAAIELSTDAPWLPTILLCAYEGLRCGEAARLKRSDVTEDSVHVRQGKGGKSRFVPTHPVVWGYIQTLPQGPIVRDQFGASVTAAWLTRAQRRHWHSIGLPDLHWHRFRHWFGTTLCDQGVGLEVVSQLMGHASVATTMGYVKVAQKRHAAAIRVLPTMTTPQPGSSRLGLSAA